MCAHDHRTRAGARVDTRALQATKGLRTASLNPDFQRALENLRERDWGAFKKRLGFARLLAKAWKATLKANGCGDVQPGKTMSSETTTLLSHPSPTACL